MKTEILLSDFVQQLRRIKADVPDIYFTLLDAAGISPTLILNLNAAAKERGIWVPFKIWTSEAAKAVHTGGCCLWVCAQLEENLQSVSIKGGKMFAVETFLWNLILARRIFKRQNVFARFKSEVWCMDLVYADKPAKYSKKVNYLLVRHDLFERTVDSKGTKTKDSKEAVHYEYKKESTQETFGSTLEQKLLDNLGNYAKLQNYKPTLQSFRPRQELLKAQYDPWKIYFTVTWKTMDTCKFTSWLNSLQHWILKEFAR